MMLSLISTQVATTYVFQAAPGEFGWAHCTVNDATGELSIQSDWGAWAHGWSPDPRHLGAPSLTLFIGNRGDVDYLARKLQREGQGGRRWSAVMTARSLRRQLCKRRLGDGREQLDARLDPDEVCVGRTRYDEEFSYRYVNVPLWDDLHRKERLPYLTRGTARRLWNLIGEMAGAASGSSDRFFERVLRIEGFCDYVTGEPWEYGVSEQTPEDRALREIVLPALIQACRGSQAAHPDVRAACEGILGDAGGKEESNQREHAPQITPDLTRIVGCTCGWRMPPGTTDSDEALLACSDCQGRRTIALIGKIRSMLIRLTSQWRNK